MNRGNIHANSRLPKPQGRSENLLLLNLEDAGAGTAAQHFDMDLGAAASALLEKESDAAWRPDPTKWIEPPERGAF